MPNHLCYSPCRPLIILVPDHFSLPFLLFSFLSFFLSFFLRGLIAPHERVTSESRARSRSWIAGDSDVWNESWSPRTNILSSLSSLFPRTRKLSLTAVKRKKVSLISEISLEKRIIAGGSSKSWQFLNFPSPFSNNRVQNSSPKK